MGEREGRRGKGEGSESGRKEKKEWTEAEAHVHTC